MIVDQTLKLVCRSLFKGNYRHLWSTSIYKDFNVNKTRSGLKDQCRGISVFEDTPRGIEYPPPPIERSPTEVIKFCGNFLKKESKAWVNEVHEKFLMDGKVFHDGDTDVLFRFDSQECLEKWRLGSDKLNNQGNSECNFIVNNQGKGVFYGTIDESVPRDGVAEMSGYCGIRTHKLTKSFGRAAHYNWLEFTHLEVRLRGDGRMYWITLGMGHYMDTMWLDLYCYFLHTRGGPYWETFRIPFSKFYLTSKGRIQDKQEAFSKIRVDSIGITCPGTTGPFKLELDYIGVHIDRKEKEEFAYELYKIPKYFVSE